MFSVKIQRDFLRFGQKLIVFSIPSGNGDDILREQCGHFFTSDWYSVKGNVCLDYP